MDRKADSRHRRARPLYECGTSQGGRGPFPESATSVQATGDKMMKLLLAVMLCLGMMRGVIAQNLPAKSQESSSMQSLLEEVHQLRLAVERVGSIMPRMQSTLQRMQMQEQRV